MEGYYVFSNRLTGYIYRQDSQEVCRALGTDMRMELVMINGMGYAWESVFDRENTLFPGIRRVVCDVETGEEVAYIAAYLNGQYSIHCGMDMVYMRLEDNRYTFRRKDTVIAVIQDCADPENTVEAFDNTFSQSLSVLCSESEDPRMLLMMLAMPRLKFAL